MIDIHCHLIHEVDDGPSTIKESMRMVLEAQKIGIRRIVATPHFYDGLFDAQKASENFKELATRVSSYGVELLQGYEVFVAPGIHEFVGNWEDLTLSGSRYLLFELPFGSIPMYCSELLYKLNLGNIIPVMAHPERNMYFIKNIDRLIDFIDEGCLVQLDAASIVGVYGSRARNFSKKLLKLGLVQFIASDAHCANDYTEWFKAAYKQVLNWVGEEHTLKLFSGNQQMILGDSQRALERKSG